MIEDYGVQPTIRGSWTRDTQSVMKRCQNLIEGALALPGWATIMIARWWLGRSAG